MSLPILSLPTWSSIFRYSNLKSKEVLFQNLTLMWQFRWKSLKKRKWFLFLALIHGHFVFSNLMVYSFFSGSPQITPFGFHSSQSSIFWVKKCLKNQVQIFRFRFIGQSKISCKHISNIVKIKYFSHVCKG